MARHTDGRPEEEFLEQARHRIEAREAHEPADEDEIPTVDTVVDHDDLDVDEHTLADNDPRVPPWWRVRKHPVWPARGLTLAVLAMVALSLLLIGAWTLSTGALPTPVEIQPTPQALPGTEDHGEPVRRRPF